MLRPGAHVRRGLHKVAAHIVGVGQRKGGGRLVYPGQHSPARGRVKAAACPGGVKHPCAPAGSSVHGVAYGGNIVKRTAFHLHFGQCGRLNKGALCAVGRCHGQVVQHALSLFHAGKQHLHGRG